MNFDLSTQKYEAFTSVPKCITAVKLGNYPFSTFQDTALTMFQAGANWRGWILVFIPPKSAQVNFLWGKNDVRTAIQQFYTPKNFYTPQNKFLATPLVSGCMHEQCESKKSPPPPRGLVAIFAKRLGIFQPNFTCLLCVPIYARLQIFIQLSATLTKLCHIKCDHPVHIMCARCPPSAETHAGIFWPFSQTTRQWWASTTLKVV